MSPAGEAAAAHGPASAARNASLDSFMTVCSFISVSPALLEGHPSPVFGAGVNGARADDFTVDSLLDDVRRPARCARYHENRGEHRGGHAHHVIGDRTIDRKSTRLNSSHRCISYAVFCLKKKKRSDEYYKRQT